MTLPEFAFEGDNVQMGNPISRFVTLPSVSMMGEASKTGKLMGASKALVYVQQPRGAIARKASLVYRC